MPILKPQEPDPLDISEAALATIGLTKILQDEMPFVGVMLQREIIGIDKRIARLAKDLIADKLPRQLDMPRAFTYQQMLDTFLKPIPEQVIEKVQHQFPDNVSDMSIQFLQYLSGTFKHVADLLPIQQYQTALGPINIEPPGDRIWKFYSQYWIVNDPLMALTLAQAGALLPEQVATLQQFYPTLHEHMKSAVLEAYTDRKVREGDKFISLPPRTERGVSVLRGEKMVPFGSNKHKIQPEQVEPQVQPVTNSQPNKSLESPAQKAAQP